MYDEQENIDELLQVIGAAKHFIQTLRNTYKGSPERLIENIVLSYESMFKRFCPFKIDDRVALKRTPDIPKSSNWYCSRHFLIEGALGTVRQRGYSREADKFLLYVELDNETWIDQKGAERPVLNKRLYYFLEDDLIKMDD